MKMKIFSAVLLGAALALAGCSGGGGSSSSTSGSTGTNASNGTSGSTGTTNTNATNGSSGSGSTTTSGSTGSGGACGTNNPSGTCANPGETCHRYTKANNSHITQCGCTPPQFDQNGNQTSADTCATNTNGKNVCDEFTLTCRLPQSFDTANLYPDGGLDQNVGCDFANNFLGLSFCNFGVTNGQCDPAPADAGPNPGPISSVACVLLCQASTDCTSATSCRLDSPLFFLFPDGGDATLPDGGSEPGGTAVGFCDVNVCGAGVLDDGGTENSDFFASCDAHGTGDGECLPVLTTGAGVCETTNSTATDQGPCDPSFVNAAPANGCPAGDLCLGMPASAGAAPGETGVCDQICNADAPDSGVYNATCASNYTNGCIAFDPGLDNPFAAGLSAGECVP